MMHILVEKDRKLYFRETLSHNSTRILETMMFERM